MGKKIVLIAVQKHTQQKGVQNKRKRYRCMACHRQSKSSPEGTDRKGYLEGICLSKTNNSSTIREAQQKQRLGTGTHTGCILTNTESYPSTRSRHCRCHLLQEELRDLGHTSATPEEEHLYPGSPRESIDVYRQGRIVLEKKGYIVQAIVLDGRPGVRQLLLTYPFRCATPPEADHHPLSYEQPQARSRY